MPEGDQLDNDAEQSKGGRPGQNRRYATVTEEYEAKQAEFAVLRQA